MMKAFVVRPFGTKHDINFEDVHKYLIAPALAACDIQGNTTEVFMQAGSIRADMFQQLLVADIVVADISIHNANVFYELGIRHALQPMRTFLLRAKSKTPPKERTAEDEVPFDLKSDRYLDYDSDHPGNRLQALIDGCRARGHDVRNGGELFSDAMGDPGTPEGTYEGMIRHNVKTIVEALK